MINYAWANPTTGVREQAATLEEARYELWKELQADYMLNDCSEGEDTLKSIFEQERCGIVSASKATLEIHQPWSGGYAYTSPVDGTRCSAGGWEQVVSDAQRYFANVESHDAVSEIVIYRQRVATTVCSTDPEPPAPVPAAPPVPDTPASLIQSVQDGTCCDLNRAQILAMLWIAEALQNAITPRPDPLPRWNSLHEFIPNSLHEFIPARPPWTPDVCYICSHPKKHSNHGWTGV